jgi:hypothetical protein
MITETLPVLHIDRSVMLPDNDQWQLRFEVKSETSDRLYTIAQNKKKKHWGYSCMSYRKYRKCKHLEALGIPCKEQPYEPQIESH